MTVDVIIPTCQPGPELPQLLQSLLQQTIRPNQIILMNTLTDECDKSRFEECYGISDNISITHIKPSEFDHATTRNQGAKLSSADYILFCTQDIVPLTNKLIEELLKEQNDEVILSYARQSGDPDCAIEWLSRAFNYPAISQIKRGKDKEELGIKTIFCSNACALYNREKFWELNGFDDLNIFNEDMLFAYRVIQSGYAIAYSASANVKHTHNYSCKKIFHRYFDQGVSQRMNQDIFEQFSSMNEGKRQAYFILGHLWENKQYKEIFRFFGQSIAKIAGYQLGIHYDKLSTKCCQELSMNKNFFKEHNK